jgi:uncharacterized protein (TIGR02284 family)
MKNQQIVSKLNNLIQMYKDSEKGYRQAAREIHDETLKTLFRRAASQRANFAREIQEEVVKLGGKPAPGGTVSGSLHRAWMKFRYQLNLHDDEIVLCECLRGDEKALGKYQDLFFDRLYPEGESMISDQCVKIVEMKDYLMSLTNGTETDTREHVLIQ